MRNSAIEIHPFTGSVGAEIRNIDLAALRDDDVDTVRHTLFDRGVVFFRDQHLTPEQHVAAAERFGPIDINRFFKHADGYPMIAEVRKEPEQKTNIGGGWHTDHSYDAAPALGSMLYAREVPPSGGDTLFASMYAAYDALSDGLKQTLEGLRADAFQPARVRRQPPQAGQRPARARRQSRAGDAGCGASGGDPPPRQRPQGAVRQPWLHPALRRLDRRRIPSAAGFPVSPRAAAGVLLPVPMGRRVGGVVGQSRDLALRGERLPWRTAADAPRHHRR